MRLLIVSMIMQSVCINRHMVYSSVKNVSKQCLFVPVLTILREKRGIFAFLWGVICPDKLLSWKYRYHPVLLEYGCRTRLFSEGRVWWGFSAGVCGNFWQYINGWYIFNWRATHVRNGGTRSMIFGLVFCHVSNALILGGLECSIVIFSEATLPLVLIWVYCYWCACQVVGASVSLTRR